MVLLLNGMTTNTTSTHNTNRRLLFGAYVHVDAVYELLLAHLRTTRTCGTNTTLKMRRLVLLLLLLLLTPLLLLLIDLNLLLYELGVVRMVLIDAHRVERGRNGRYNRWRERKRTTATVAATTTTVAATRLVVGRARDRRLTKRQSLHLGTVFVIPDTATAATTTITTTTAICNVIAIRAVSDTVHERGGGQAGNMGHSCTRATITVTVANVWITGQYSCYSGSQ